MGWRRTQQDDLRGAGRSQRARSHVAVAITALTLLITLSAVPDAEAVCCICRGAVNGCSVATPLDCAGCEGFCGGIGTSIGCCEGATDCSQGVADSCTGGQNVCTENSTGFCNGSCTGPTSTPTVTPPATPTDTAPPTLTPTPAPNGAGCDDPTDCVSENCVDDTCCAAPSCPVGQSCDNPGNAGICSPDPIAPAPALSRDWLLLGLGLLVAIGARAMGGRRAR